VLPSQLRVTDGEYVNEVRFRVAKHQTDRLIFQGLVLSYHEGTTGLRRRLQVLYPSILFSTYEGYIHHRSRLMFPACQLFNVLRADFVSECSSPKILLRS
jgi:hypothetical protein